MGIIYGHDPARVCSSLLTLPGVVGVGYGLKERATNVLPIPAWRIYVRVKRPRLDLHSSELIPAQIGGLPTDVLTYAPVSPASGHGPGLGSGSKIANARGVPGTLGCIVRTVPDSQPAILSNWHVLFGHGSPEHSTVWAVDDSAGTRRFLAIGKTLYGKLGTVQLGSKAYYVDCAVGSCSISDDWSSRRSAPPLVISGHDTVQPGSPVTKVGAATGVTAGIVVDTGYSDVAWTEGRHYAAPHQLLVKPIDGLAAFSAAGDSGAIIVNAAGKAIGLLWGTNSRGEGIASPIEPVLYTLNVRLEQPATY